MKLTNSILKEMVKQQLFERRVNLSAYKEANFGKDFVQLVGRAGMLKLTKRDVHSLAKVIRSQGGAAGMGWSFTAFEGKLKENGNIKFSKEEMAKLHKDGKLEKDGHTYTFSEGKLTEGKVVRLPSGHKVKVEFKGLTFSATRGKDVFLDRSELQRFFKATRKYLYK